MEVIANVNAEVVVDASVGDDSAATELRDAVVRTVGAGSGADSIVSDLLDRHAEPHRRYHTAEHVMWVLRFIARLSSDCVEARGMDRAAVDAAALFHDAVYDPRSDTNEADSATLASAHLRRSGWDDERIATVERLIVATAGHQPTSGHQVTDAAEAVLLDADLAILGATPDDYATYVGDVRAEYSFVGDERWRAGRADVLCSFLDRERIFATSTMLIERESRARANLAAELAALRSPSV
ncbi:MAG: hypothetical protein ABIR32_14660 [Ilumatobacteraceae bacterium]